MCDSDSTFQFNKKNLSPFDTLYIHCLLSATYTGHGFKFVTTYLLFNIESTNLIDLWGGSTFHKLPDMLNVTPTKLSIHVLYLPIEIHSCFRIQE